MKDNSRNFLQIPTSITIVFIILLIGVGIFFAINQYIDNQKDEMQKLVKKQEQTLEYAQLEINKLKEESAEAKQEFQDVNQKTKELEKRLSDVNNIDLTLYVNEWQPRIAYIVCAFTNQYSGENELFQGSGMVIKWATGKFGILTNKHVVQDNFGNLPSLCSISFIGGKSDFIVPKKNIRRDPSLDLGIIDILEPDNYILSLIPNKNNVCAETAPIGSDVVILGFPGIGSNTSITATEGIISGDDGEYYITSAKVEQGNSGGAAILVGKNCYLGIPSYAKVGNIESLARILSAGAIFIGDLTNF